MTWGRCCIVLYSPYQIYSVDDITKVNLKFLFVLPAVDRGNYLSLYSKDLDFEAHKKMRKGCSIINALPSYFDWFSIKESKEILPAASVNGFTPHVWSN